jgi:hypothetical protein
MGSGLDFGFAEFIVAYEGRWPSSATDLGRRLYPCAAAKKRVPKATLMDPRYKEIAERARETRPS